MIRGEHSHRIFVFGSNLKGRHGRGAALHASIHYGAKEGKGFGHIGNSYAIPTKDAEIRTLPLSRIRSFVQVFIDYAHANPLLQFNVTQIGCGLAGYSPEKIAPIFLPIQHHINCWFDPTWQKFLDPRTQFWTHPI